MSASAKDSKFQRVRWEQAGVETINQYAGEMWRLAWNGNPLEGEGLFDIMIPPIAVTALLLLLGFAVGTAAAKLYSVALILAMLLDYLFAAFKYISVFGFFHLLPLSRSTLHGRLTLS